jgi:hypothetical protein
MPYCLDGPLKFHIFGGRIHANIMTRSP